MNKVLLIQNILPKLKYNCLGTPLMETYFPIDERLSKKLEVTQLNL